jgi:hypothetical protein
MRLRHLLLLSCALLAGGCTTVADGVYALAESRNQATPAAKAYGFGPWEALVGGAYVPEAKSYRADHILRIEKTSGDLVLQYADLQGRPSGRFVLRLTDVPGTYDMIEAPYEEYVPRRGRLARIDASGALHLKHRYERFNYLPQEDSDRLVITGNGITQVTNAVIGPLLNRDRRTEEYFYKPASDNTIASAQVALQERREYEARVAARNAEIERQNRSHYEAQWARERQEYMGKLMGDLQSQVQHNQAVDARNAALAEQARRQMQERARPAATPPVHAAPASPRAAAPALAAAPPRAPSPPTVKRTAYPEAIVVCTFPNEKGLFKCANPIHEVSGGKDNSLSEWRTPERMLASFKSTCWEPRKLPSTTHLVWACGYGATGGVDHKDRGGPGIDAKGRKTFYCTEAESSCRRTEP